MLKLRRGVVVEAGAGDRLVVDVGGERRAAWIDRSLLGPAEAGDEVVVNTAAVDLGLGSGGFDVVHVNLTRGLAGGETAAGIHVMKLNYSSLQHAVDPAEAPLDSPPRPSRPVPVLVLPLHGHLAPVAWAAAGVGRVGFIQAAGGGLPGTLSRDVAELLDRGLLAEHLTAAPSYGGGGEAISLIGALHAAAEELGWDAAIVGPGPGIIGSETRYGHGGMAALDGAHCGLALGLPTLLSPRLSAADPRPRHRGLSHHTAAVLELLLGPVEVPLPAGLDALLPAGAGDPLAAIAAPHRASEHRVDIDGYAASGLPTRTMGRELAADRLFFAAALAAGAALRARSGA